jgi:hypothetical protein
LKRANLRRKWSTIRKAGCVSAIDFYGRTIWIADAYRGDGNRFVVLADEKLSAFLEIESVIRGAVSALTSWRDFITLDVVPKI